MTETTSLEFTEEMKGFVTLDETDTQRGYDRGRADETKLMFRLTIRTEDVDTFVAEPSHQAGADGYVDCDLFGGRRPVEKGVFNLFVGDRPDERRMLYRLFFADSAGHPLTLSGFKDVRDDPGFDVWRDTSTLFTTIYAGHVGPDEESAARAVAAGIITIHIPDFVKQLTTFRVSGPGAGSIPAGLEKFGRLFLGQLWGVYGRHLATADDPR
jgi:cholesterol oxidase